MELNMDEELGKKGGERIDRTEKKGEEIRFQVCGQNKESWGAQP